MNAYNLVILKMNKQKNATDKPYVIVEYNLFSKSSSQQEKNVKINKKKHR